MARERKRAEVAAQLIHHGARAEGVGELQELEEGGFGPVPEAGLLFGKGTEGLLEAVELKLRKALVGEGVGEAEGELLCYRIRTWRLRASRIRYLSRVGRRDRSCPGPWCSIGAV